MSTDELRRLAAVRMQMLEAHPFWGYLLLQVRMIPAPGLPSFITTDGVSRIWFNPALTCQLKPDQLAFVLLHAVAHQVFHAVPRRAGRNPYLWHRAVDYVINRIILAIEHPSGWGHLYQPPRGTYEGLGKVKVLLDDDFEGLIAEAIYEELAAQPPEEDPPVCHDLTLPVAADGEPGEDEDDEPGLRFMQVMDHHGGVDLHLPVTPSPEDRERLIDRLAAAVGVWKEAGRRGDLPGNEIRRLGLLERPRVPWQRVLHRFMDQALTLDDYSRTRPNRRYLEYDVIVPGLVGQSVPSVVVALDTSGSMSTEVLRSALGEIRGLTDHVAEVTLILADSQVTGVIEPTALEAFLRHPVPQGGGGTDHRPVFDYIRDQRLAPAVFVGLTDLASRFPPVPPSYPVLWVVPPDHAPAPWGQVIVQR